MKATVQCGDRKLGPFLARGPCAFRESIAGPQFLCILPCRHARAGGVSNRIRSGRTFVAHSTGIDSFALVFTCVGGPRPLDVTVGKQARPTAMVFVSVAGTNARARTRHGRPN